MINKVMQEIIKLNHCAKSTADLSQIWAANEVLISEFGWNNSCHSIWRRYFIFFPRLDAILSTNVPTNKQTNKHIPMPAQPGPGSTGIDSPLFPELSLHPPPAHLFGDAPRMLCPSSEQQ